MDFLTAKLLLEEAEREYKAAKADLASAENLLAITLEECGYVSLDGEICRFLCPHCRFPVEVLKKELNCRIFRHGVYKKTGKPMDPHAKKEVCDQHVRDKLIYGCAGPFEIIGYVNMMAIKCEYK